MLISKQWLQQFIDISKVAPQEIAKRLTLSTVEVEGLMVQGEGFEKIVVGLVKSVEKHPNADKLNVCIVDIGKKEVKIVCGGSNVRHGMKVALAQIGAKVRWHGQGDLVELKPVEIRGVASEGMICASDEIGLSEMFPKKEEKEILDLSHISAKPGTPLASALGLDDVIFEIDNKSLSHRPDLWGHYGIAREVAALFKRAIRPYHAQPIKRSGGQAIRRSSDQKIIVDVQDKKLCPRYMMLAVDGVTIAPSPRWVQDRLKAAGVRPVNNIVDITNYVMHEIGQPMHAFDARYIAESDGKKKMIVRRAKDGEQFVSLDGKMRHLTKDMIVVADPEKIVDLAGIMGGKNSEIVEDTTTVIFEAANFEPTAIRKASTTLGLRSDASARFEKGLSPEKPELAMRRAVELVYELCPGARVASVVVDKKVPLKKPLAITLDTEVVKKKVGMSIPHTEQANILQRLGFVVRKTTLGLRVTVPIWRQKDITIPEDLIEEIVRIYGYEKIPATLPNFPIAPPAPNPLRILERRLKELLAYEQGFTEVYNYSFVAPEWLEKMGFNSVDFLALDNPIAKDRPLLRRSLKPGLLENVESNLHRFPRVRLFEIGRTFLGETLADGLPLQPNMLGLTFADGNNNTPFFVLSSTLQETLVRVGVQVVLEKDADIGPLYHPGRSAYVVVQGQKVGSIGEIHPIVAARLGIPKRVAIAEVSLDAILPFVKEQSSYQSISLYPSITRDVAFLVDKRVAHAEIEKVVQTVGPLITGVELFDVYEGANVGAGKKSMAYHITYGSREKTLEAKEVDGVHATAVDLLRKKFGVEIRK